MLHNGHRLTSPDRHTTVLFDNRGDLVMKNDRGTIWHVDNHGKARGGTLRLRHNGELVVLDKRNREVWSSHSGGRSAGPNPVLRMQNDGRLAVHDRTGIIWHTNTKSP